MIVYSLNYFTYWRAPESRLQSPLARERPILPRGRTPGSPCVAKIGTSAGPAPGKNRARENCRLLRPRYSHQNGHSHSPHDRGRSNLNLSAFNCTSVRPTLLTKVHSNTRILAELPAPLTVQYSFHRQIVLSRTVLTPLSLKACNSQLDRRTNSPRASAQLGCVKCTI